MRCAIIGDIHANLVAMTAVFDDIRRQGGADKVWCLGDIVGYGPEPHECVELLQQVRHVCVAGNHDLAAIGKVSTVNFNPDAAAAAEWTARHLTQSDIEYLDRLPMIIEEDGFTLAHGSPREPIWEYVISTGIARENFKRFKTPYCLVGHSHRPMVFISEEKGECSAGDFSPRVKIALGDTRLIVNPGSVGQPRDGDPQASYAMYDSDMMLLRLFRVPYDVQETQDRMVERNLPLRLVARLSYGM
jgi:predicted phosphodiesterase